MLNLYYDKFIFVSQVKFVNNNFFLVNIPFLMVPAELLLELTSRNDEELNKKIYYSVKNSVKGKLIQQFNAGPKMEGRKLIEFFLDYFSNSGWGKLEIIQLDEEKKRAIITLSNSPFALPLQGKLSFSVDHFIRGILAGLFSNALHADLECMELKCIASGNSECEFIVNKPIEFDFGKETTRKQLNPKI